jgi:hypothetical protein
MGDVQERELREMEQEIGESGWTKDDQLRGVDDNQMSEW